MMHADLIDQEDLRERLVALGLSIPAGVTAAQACEHAVSGGGIARRQRNRATERA